MLSPVKNDFVGFTALSTRFLVIAYENIDDINLNALCLDAGVSALSSYQTLISDLFIWLI